MNARTVAPRWLLLVATVVVLVIHVGLRAFTWTHEWLLTTWQYSFATIMLGPLFLGFNAWSSTDLARTYGAPTQAAGRTYATVARSTLTTTWPALTLYLTGWVGALVTTAVAHSPGSVTLSDLLPIIPAALNLIALAGLGAFLGWRLPHVITAPLSAAAVFGLGIVIYGTPLSFLSDTGGASGSLVGLAPNLARLAFQAAVFALVAALAPLWASRDAYRAPGARTATYVGTSALAIACLGGGYVNPERLQLDAADQVVCERADREYAPEVCLGPGYRERAIEISAAFSDPTEQLQSLGLSGPDRYDQRAAAEDASTAVVDPNLLDQGPSSAAQTLAAAQFPPGCAYYNDDTLLDDFTGLAWWLTPADARQDVADPSMLPADLTGTPDQQTRWLTAAIEAMHQCST